MTCLPIDSSSGSGIPWIVSVVPFDGIDDIIIKGLRVLNTLDEIVVCSLVVFDVIDVISTEGNYVGCSNGESWVHASLGSLNCDCFLLIYGNLFYELL